MIGLGMGFLYGIINSLRRWSWHESPESFFTAQHPRRKPWCSIPNC